MAKESEATPNYIDDGCNKIAVSETVIFEKGYIKHINVRKAPEYDGARAFDFYNERGKCVATVPAKECKFTFEQLRKIL